MARGEKRAKKAIVVVSPGRPHFYSTAIGTCLVRVR
jgi:hypothetical protein